MNDNKHRNDIYGDDHTKTEEENPTIPAATFVLLRDGKNGVETLMLHRTSKVHFGGMWVFPGGRIDPEDYDDSGDVNAAARTAAARETMEEAGIEVKADEFAWFAHWTPPAMTPRRYATWFFATAIDHDDEILIDGHEIQDHDWISPEDALARHAKGEIDLAPPTWITLNHLSMYSPTEAIMKRFLEIPHKVYVTRIGVNEDGHRCTMWQGDAGYEANDPNLPGDRHRLIMAEEGFKFENTIEEY